MSESFIQDLALVSFPWRGRFGGTFAMLECYADDSGTHGSSRVIVWAGIAGNVKFFEELEAAWHAKLAKPCNGRPAISKFHSHDLFASRREFVGYTQAERDATRHDFRQIIIDAGLTWLSYGISTSAWDQYATGMFRQAIPNPERIVFGELVVAACNSAHKDGEPISFQFDKGRTGNVCPMIKPAVEESDIDDHRVRYRFSPVGANVGLQAADLVAHETYQYFVKYIDDPDAEVNIHLQRLMAGVHDYMALWYGEVEIDAKSKRVNKAFKEEDVFIPSEQAGK